MRGAIRVVASRGGHNLKMIDVARATGVGKGTLYEYFPSKNDLIIGCFELLISRYEAYTKQAIKSDLRPDEHLRQFIKASLDFCKAEKELMEVMMDFLTLGIPRKEGEPLLPGVVVGYEQVINELADVMRRGTAEGLFRPVDPQIAAQSLFALLDGLYFQAAMGLINLEEESLPKKLSQIFLAGVLK